MKLNNYIPAFVAILIVMIIATYPYQQPIKAYPFVTGNDTLGSISSVDTVKWRPGHNDLNDAANWNSLSTYITAANKTGEETVVFDLANETDWTWMEYLEIQIASSAGTLTSSKIYVGERLGALTLFVQPDTIGDPQDSTIYKVRLGGQ